MSVPYSLYNTRSATDPGAPVTNTFAVSGTPTVYSDMWSGESSDGFNLSVFTTGTITGTWTLWMTDMPYPGLTNDNDWIQDTTFAPTNPAGAASKYQDATGNSKAYRKRLKYVNASGTGNIQAFATVPHFSY